MLEWFHRQIKMPKNFYFSQYESPNIVVVPDGSFNCTSSPPKKKKIDNSEHKEVVNVQAGEKCVFPQKTMTNLPNVSNSSDITRVLNRKANKSNTSWASNYLQSIGHINKKPIKIKQFSSMDKAMQPTNDTLVQHCDQNELQSSHIQNKPLIKVIHKGIFDLTTHGNTIKKKDDEDNPDRVSSNNLKNYNVRTLSYRNEKSDNYHNKLRFSDNTKANSSKLLQKSYESHIKDKFNKDQLKTLNIKENSTNNKDNSKIKFSNKEAPKPKHCFRDSILENSNNKKYQNLKKYSNRHTRVNENIPKSHSDSENKLNNKNLYKTKLNRNPKCENPNSPIEIVSEIKNLPDNNCNSKQTEFNDHVKNKHTITTDSSQLNNSYKHESEMKQVASNKSLKSVVQVTERFDLNKTQNQIFTHNFDLRCKLNRKNLMSCKEMYKKPYKNSRHEGEIPRERLENVDLTVQQNEEMVDVKAPVKNKAPSKAKSKTKNCKKIKLVINVICQKPLDSSIESSFSSETDSDSEDCSLTTKDLSFLDDFNVDEIVECLKHSQNEIDTTPQKENDQLLGTDHINNSCITTVKGIIPIKNEIKIENDKIIRNNEKIAKNIYKFQGNHANLVLDRRSGTINNHQECIKKKYDILQLGNIRQNESKKCQIDDTIFENKIQPLLPQVNKALKLNHIIVKNTQQIPVTIDETPTAHVSDHDKTVLNNNIVEENTQVKIIEHEEVYPSNNLDVKSLQLNYIINENDQQVIIIEDYDQTKPLNKKTKTVQKEHHNIVSVKNQQINTISKTIDIAKHYKQHKTNVNEISIPQEICVKKDVSEVRVKIDVIVIEDEDSPAPLNNQSNVNIEQIDISCAPESINALIKSNISSKIIQEVNINSNHIENTQTVHDSKPIVKSEEKINVPIESNKISNLESSISASDEEGINKVSSNFKPLINSTNVVNVKHSTSRDNSPTIINTSDPKLSPIKEISILSQPDRNIAEKLERRMYDYLYKECTVTSLIRRGKFSKIYRCQNSDGENYAIKMLNDKSHRRTLGINKQKILMQLQKDIPKENLNCIYVINGFGLEGYWCYLMEYYPKNLQQALKERNKPFHIDEVQDLSRQLVSAVTVLRNYNIVHSDIKPNHILLNATNDKLKLCGFDSSYKNYCVRLLPNIGTVNYRAPEIILGYSTGYSIDVWSTALVMYEMATNSKLFPGAYNNNILFQQMCIFGNLSYDMMQKSFFVGNHFIGNVFSRRVGLKGKQTILVPKFHRMNVVGPNLFRLYNEVWGNTRTKSERLQDLCKVDSFYKLLEGMLCIDPLRRLPIEFVCANPFIYKKFM